MKTHKGISRYANLHTLVIFFGIFTLFFIGCGGGGGGTTAEDTSSSLTEKEIQDALDMDVVDRTPVLHTTLGAPDTFIKVVDELQGQMIVSEEWSYLELGIRIDMVDGEIGSVSAIESLPDDVALYPRFYDPDEFTLPMDRDEVLKILDGQEYTEFDLSEAGIDPSSMIIGDQIMLGFADDLLVYVETYAHEPDPEDELSQLYIDEGPDAAVAPATLHGNPEAAILSLPDISDYQVERASAIESLLPPNARLVVGFFRLLRARNQRNQVYREARNVQKEYGEYLDRLYDKATEMAGTCKLKTSDRQRTIATLNKIRARIDKERQALKDYTEGEKKTARSRFIRKARGQIIEALRTSGIGTRVLQRIKESANIDETLSDLQKVVDGVLDPGGFKQSLSLRLEKLEILSQVVGGPVGKDFRDFISQAQKTIPGLGELQDAAEDLQIMLNNTKAQIEKVEAAMAQDKNIISPAILLGNIADMGKEKLSDPAIDTLTKALSEAMGPKYARNLLVATGVLDPKQFGTMYERFRGTLLQQQTAVLQQLPKNVCGRPVGQDMRDTIEEDPLGDDIPFGEQMQTKLPLYQIFETLAGAEEYGSPVGPDGEPLPICKSLPIDFDSLHDEMMKTLNDENYIDLSQLDICRSEDDADGDGYTRTAAGGDDCNDSKAFINPGTAEVCDDGIDNDCNGDDDCADTACTNDSACLDEPDDDPCLDTPGVYVWYVDNLPLKDVFVSQCASYLAENALCGYQGGGLDCSITADKILLGSGYDTTEDAVNATCSTVSITYPCGSTWSCGWLGDIGGQQHVIDGLGGCQ